MIPLKRLYYQTLAFKDGKIKALINSPSVKRVMIKGITKYEHNSLRTHFKNANEVKKPIVLYQTSRSLNVRVICSPGHNSFPGGFRLDKLVHRSCGDQDKAVAF
jgi:hypothetical protein